MTQADKIHDALCDEYWARPGFFTESEMAKAALVPFGIDDQELVEEARKIVHDCLDPVNFVEMAEQISRLAEQRAREPI